MNDGTGLKYLLTDHLGSMVSITDNNASMISRQRYLPSGGVRTDIGTIPQTDFGYTGQSGQRNLDSGIGLMDYRARFYSSSLGRFIQPDTITPDMTQGLNRYSYVNNNPVNFNDPSGHAYCDFIDNQNAEDCNGGLSNSQSSSVIWRNSNENSYKNSGNEDGNDGDGGCTNVIVCNLIGPPKKNPFDLSLYSGEDICNFLLQGTQPCNFSFHSTFGNAFENSSGTSVTPANVLSGWSQFISFANAMRFFRGEIPGFFGYSADYAAQLSIDEGKYNDTEMHLRANLVAIEGIATSFISVYASGASAVAGLELGPADVLLIAAVYTASNHVFTTNFGNLNSTIGFPIIHRYSNP